MKPRIAFIKTPDPRGFSEDIIDALDKSLSARNFETKVLTPNPDNIQDVVNQLFEFKPLFTFDINLDGVIFAEDEKGEKKPLFDIVGNIHVSWFLEDPMLHYMKLKPVISSNQLLFLNVDIEHGQWLAQLGKNVAFLAPAVNPSKVPPPMEKEFDVAFVGPVIDPSIYENAWKERLDEGLYMFATELGRLIYRNPDMPLRYASSFMISQFNPQFQESLMKFQQERDEDFMALLAEIGGYAMNLRRWHIIDSIDDIEINVLGEVRGETKENVVVYEDINNLKDITTFLSRSKISLLSQPPFLPSSLGLTTFYSVAANTLTMVEEKLSAKSFFVEEQEIITYHPMDSVEIEGKLIYYLEDAPNEREEIAKNGKDRVFKDHTLYQRGEILGNILEDIIQQASQQSNQEKN